MVRLEPASVAPSLLSLTLTQRAGFDWGAKAEAFIAALRGQTNTVALWHFARPTVRGTLASATCATVAVQVLSPAEGRGAVLAADAAVAVHHEERLQGESQRRHPLLWRGL